MNRVRCCAFSDASASLTAEPCCALCSVLLCCAAVLLLFLAMGSMWSSQRQQQTTLFHMNFSEIGKKGVLGCHRAQQLQTDERATTIPISAYNTLQRKAWYRTEHLPQLGLDAARIGRLQRLALTLEPPRLAGLVSTHSCLVSMYSSRPLLPSSLPFAAHTEPTPLGSRRVGAVRVDPHRAVSETLCHSSCSRHVTDCTPPARPYLVSLARKMACSSSPSLNRFSRQMGPNVSSCTMRMSRWQ